MAKTFTIGDCHYQSRPMDAVSQLKIMRRLGPALGPLSELLPIINTFRAQGASVDEFTSMILSSSDDKGVKQLQEAAGRGVESLGRALGTLDDESIEFITGKSLELCQRRKVGAEGSWADVWNKDTGRPQFTDISSATMLKITWIVLAENLGSFFREQFSTSAAE